MVPPSRIAAALPAVTVPVTWAVTPFAAAAGWLKMVVPATVAVALAADVVARILAPAVVLNVVPVRVPILAAVPAVGWQNTPTENVPLILVLHMDVCACSAEGNNAAAPSAIRVLTQRPGRPI
ncbi:hypothetical protein D3C81_1392520 [compost metagenome]